MSKYIALIIGVLTFVQPAFAALAPLNEGVVEIKAILSNEKLYDAIGSGETIQKIQKTESGYVVITREHELVIDVKYLPVSHPGPQKFELHFNKPTPITHQRN